MSRFNPLLLKLLTTGCLILLLLLPLNQVESLITERSNTRANAIERVASGSGHEQRIGAAMLTIPVTRSGQVDGNLFSQLRRLRVLAKDVVISGTVSTEIHHSGIYQIPAFQASIHLSGAFSDPSLQEQIAPEPGVDADFGRSMLFIAISDPTGIRSLEGIQVDGVTLPVSPATENGLSGISAELPATRTQGTLPKQFSIDFIVSGTERLQWLPLASSTTVKLTSSWPDPAFSGAFAPRRSNITSGGFTAEWRVLEINRDFPQHWIDDAVTSQQISHRAFGVDFYQPVDTYQQNYRSIHYAALLIAIAFMALFLWEHTLGQAIHPMQYGMVGAALSLYLLLLAFSEHLSFGAAYGLAGSATTGLLTLYFAGALASARIGALAGSMIGISYVLLYWLILSADYALLSGTVALFLMLTAIMLGTRRLNWYSIAVKASRTL